VLKPILNMCLLGKMLDDSISVRQFTESIVQAWNLRQSRFFGLGGVEFVVLVFVYILQIFLRLGLHHRPVVFSMSSSSSSDIRLQPLQSESSKTLALRSSSRSEDTGLQMPSLVTACDSRRNNSRRMRLPDNVSIGLSLSDVNDTLVFSLDRQ